MKYEEEADQREREADRMEQHSEDVERKIEDAREEWKAKESDSSVPGAQPEPEEDEAEDS